MQVMYVNVKELLGRTAVYIEFSGASVPNLYAWGKKLTIGRVWYSGYTK